MYLTLQTNTRIREKNFYYELMTPKESNNDSNTDGNESGEDRFLANAIGRQQLRIRPEIELLRSEDSRLSHQREKRRWNKEHHQGWVEMKEN